MDYIASIIILILSLVIVRDIFFRFIFIYPKTSINGWLSRTIEQEDLYRIVPNQYKNNKWDILFIGNSHVMDAIDPSYIANHINRKAYNFCFYYIPIPNMLEICMQSDMYPPVIFIDFSTRYSIYNDNYPFALKLESDKSFSLSKEKLLNSISYFLPSIFIPEKYSDISKKFFTIIRNISNVKSITIGRYTPYRHFINFQWSLDIRTNHRKVLRNGRKRKTEKFLESLILRKSINDTKKLCDNESALYMKSMEILKSYVEKAHQRGSTVYFMRLPLDKRLIDHENIHCKYYFNDIKEIANKYNITFIDLTITSVYSDINYYIDGQHLDSDSAQKLTAYLTNKYLYDQFIFN